MQAQASLQAKRVAGAQAGGHDGCRGEQLARKLLCALCRHSDLEAVFAGVAAARDHAALGPGVDAVDDAVVGAVHEAERVHLAALHERAQDGRRRGALQGEQVPVEQVVDLHAGRGLGCHVSLEGRVHVRGDRVLVRAVHHDGDEALVSHVRGDDRVVDDAALGVGEEAQRRVPRAEGGHVTNDEALQEVDGIVARQPQLAHVRDVEQRSAALVPGVVVLGEHTGLVLNRQVVASELDHLASELFVQVKESSLLDRPASR
mmetsp:Transcript_406/g.1456  ORF Transcript_406/g.1456 Transcript_406/m.1456 type:complete len:260 (+) Transcript_406:1185-1964(+)